MRNRTELSAVVVEDHQIFLDALAQALSLDEDIRLAGAYGVPERAVDKAREESIDVLVTDLEWRADLCGGIKLIHRFLALSPETKVLVCSAHDDEQSIRQAIQAGASGYLLKDEVSGADVVQAVKSVCHGRPAYSDTIIHTITRLLKEAQEGKPAMQPLDRLTRREREILPLLVDGLSNTEIAERLSVAEKTVKTHVSHILQKLNVSSRHQVAGYAR